MKKILFALLCAGVVACTKAKPTLDGDYRMLNAPENAEITLLINGNDFSGQAAVNRYFGSLSREGNTIKFMPAGSTMMAGPRNLMRVETNYLQGLDKIHSWKLDGNRLVLTDDNGKELIFERQSTAN